MQPCVPEGSRIAGARSRVISAPMHPRGQTSLKNMDPPGRKVQSSCAPKVQPGWRNASPGPSWEPSTKSIDGTAGAGVGLPCSSGWECPSMSASGGAGWGPAVFGGLHGPPARFHLHARMLTTMAVRVYKSQEEDGLPLRSVARICLGSTSRGSALLQGPEPSVRSKRARVETPASGHVVQTGVGIRKPT